MISSYIAVSAGPLLVEKDRHFYLRSRVIPEEVAPVRIGLHETKLEYFLQTQFDHKTSNL